MFFAPMDNGCDGDAEQSSVLTHSNRLDRNQIGLFGLAKQCIYLDEYLRVRIVHQLDGFGRALRHT